MGDVVAVAVTDGVVAGAPSRSYVAFYHDNVGAVLGLVIAVHGDRSSAEEITQEAFARAWERWDRIGGYDLPGAWVRRVALNLATSRARRRRSDLAVKSRLRLRRRADPPEPADESIWREVAKLPRRQAQVVALTYVEDLDSLAIAHVLGIEPGTVRVHLARARRTLQSTLEAPC